MKKGIINRPEVSQSCQISDGAMTDCKTKFEELKKASDVFSSKTIPKMEASFEEYFKQLTGIRTNLACMSCDPKAQDSYNIAGQTVRITREQYQTFAEGILGFHLIKYTEVLEYIKLYIQYATLINPAANLLIDDYDDRLRIVQDETQKCFKAKSEDKNFEL